MSYAVAMRPWPACPTCGTRVRPRDGPPGRVPCPHCDRVHDAHEVVPDV